MIDNPDQVERLLSLLRRALPLPATASPPLIATLRNGSPPIEVTPRCMVTELHYLGDEGGITCGLDCGAANGSNVILVSITSLIFDPRLPVTREIVRYQKHRVKRLRRAHAPMPANDR